MKKRRGMDVLEKEKTVQILLSTYNGEKYLREQLDCFLCQKNVRIRVLIRDDGSSDGTVEILKEYHEEHGFEFVLGENIGVNASVYELLKAADPTVDFYAISDQDDWWHPNKIFAAVEKLQAFDQQMPLLYGARISVADEALTHMFFSQPIYKGVSLYNAMVQNVLPGHTQVFNNAMREFVLAGPIDDVVVIDWWMYLIASGTGTVVYDDRVFVKHRQHGKNAVGYRKGGIMKFVERLKRIRSGKANVISRQIRSFYLCYFQFIKEAYKNELEFYLKSLGSFGKRFHYIMACKVYRQTFFETALYKFLYLIGKYKI